MKPKFVILILFFVGLLVSAIRPHDYFTWFLEVVPALIALLLLTITYPKFQFTGLVYWLLLLHCYILFIGGHYTYAEVPLFDWIKDAFHLSRNNYDKVGHFFQGFVPALLVRELFKRKDIVRGNTWLAFVSICVCLAFSAFYEMIEWWVSVGTGSAGDAFLGTQGYIWDTQSDMMMCLIGATGAMLLLSKVQDRAIGRL